MTSAAVSHLLDHPLSPRARRRSCALALFTQTSPTRRVLRMPAMAELRARLAELADLSALGGLAGWDQRVMMPPRARPRARTSSPRSTVSRTSLRAPRRSASGSRSWKAVSSTRSTATSSASHGGTSSASAACRQTLSASERRPPPRDRRRGRQRAPNADFAAFAPALARNVELARAYAACFKDAARPYDALLYDFDYGVATERVEATFARLADGLRPADRRCRPAA